MLPSTPYLLLRPANVVAAAAADAAQTTAFLARTSGLSGTETAAYKALINGLVADGTFALLDALYIFATNTTTTANLNLVSTSFGLTKTGSVTFTADVGYTGDGSTGFFDTGLSPFAAGGNFAQNSASLGAYILQNRTTDANNVAMGAVSDGGSNFSYMQPLTSTGHFFWDTNAATFPSFSPAPTSTKGAWVTTRTGASTGAAYKNGSSSSVGTNSGASFSLLGSNIFILALNNGAASQFSNDQTAAAFIGGGLTGAQSASINNRINTYMTALGINVY